MGDFNSVTSTDTAAEKQRKINEIPFEKFKFTWIIASPILPNRIQ